MDADRYQSAILAPIVVPLYQQHDLVFQQDSAPYHTAKRNAEFLRSENINFWTKEDWPPNSSDLNPLDYGIWGMLQQEVYRVPPKSLQDLERKIRKAWEKMDSSRLIDVLIYLRADYDSVKMPKADISNENSF